MKKLRVGVIGLNMGRYHLRHYQDSPLCDVVAISEKQPQLLKHVGDEFEINKRYEDGFEMLQDDTFDIVSVVVPNRYHKAMTLAALDAGAHVLCEKPLALNAAEGREMVEAAKAAHRRLMINYTYRFHPSSWALHQQITSGRLGHAYHGRSVWHRRRGLPPFAGFKAGQKALQGGGPLVDLGVHRLDLALWYMGFPEPDWVLGSTYNHLAAEQAHHEGWLFDVEDFASGYIRFRNGASLSLEASWMANIAEDELMETRVLGTNGGVLQRNRGGEYAFEGAVYYEQEGQHYNLAPAGGASSTNAMAYFADCIVRDEPHMATGEEGVRVLQILDAIYESAQLGQPVRVDG